MKKNVNRKNKVIGIVLVTILVILLLLFLGAFLLVKSYLNKINYDHEVELVQATTIERALSDEEIMEELLADEPDTGESDSPEEDIAQLEEQMEQQKIEQNNQLSTNADRDGVQTEDGITNILLVGCDTRKQGGAGRSDSMILVSVNEETQKIHLSSIMRDSYVAIPGRSNNRINAAYAFGGGSLLLNTIESNFAVDVDRYVAFDFYSFVDVVDSMGGIEIEVSDAEIPVLNGYVRELNRLNGRAEDTYLVTKSGLQLLNGTQALGYARIRYVGNGDFERTERQRIVVQKLFEKAKTMNLLELNDLLNILLPEVKTNLTQDEILSLALKAVTYLSYDMDSLRIPVDGSYKSMRVNGMAVLGIDLKTNQDALSDFIAQ